MISRRIILACQARGSGAPFFARSDPPLWRGNWTEESNTPEKGIAISPFVTENLNGLVQSCRDLANYGWTKGGEEELTMIFTFASPRRANLSVSDHFQAAARASIRLFTCEQCFGLCAVQDCAMTSALQADRQVRLAEPRTEGSPPPRRAVIRSTMSAPRGQSGSTTEVMPSPSMTAAR